jgi:hypothetical protein
MNITVVLSQNSFKPFSEIGAKIGVSMASTYIIDNDDAVPFTGPMVGFKFLHMEQRILGILLEANLTKLYNDSEGNTLSYTYIHVPLLTRFNISATKNSLIGFNLGSYVQMILDSDSKINLDRNSLFGLAGSLDAGYSFGKMVLTLEGRVNYNLHSNSKDDDALRGQWVELGLSVTFRK